MKFNRQTFFDSYRKDFGNLNQNQISGLEKLLDSADVDPTITDLRWLAYMLATVKHECADTYEPITERGQKDYFNKYNSETDLGKKLGNTQAGDGYAFRGRGYVQITGRANYARLGKSIGLAEGDDLIVKPDKALSADTAYKIMSYGMIKGSFTGKKLSDYINASKADYKEARKIINWTDQAEKIEGYAIKFESILNQSLIPANTGATINITEDEKKKIFENNILEINKMYVPAGSMVKNLIMELQRDNRDTYIKLRNAAVNGHIVNYDFLEGDKNLVVRIAKALGFKNVTGDSLEVRNV
jgi:hypothetical protein